MPRAEVWRSSPQHDDVRMVEDLVRVAIAEVMRMKEDNIVSVEEARGTWV